MHALLIAAGLLAGLFAAPDAARGVAIVDPAADAIAIFGEPGPLVDIATVTVTVGGGALQVSATFHSPIAPASLAVANSLAGGFDFDLDRNSSTGSPPFQNLFPPLAPLDFGSELSVDFFSELFHPGSLDVFDNVAFAVIGTVPATFTATGVSFALPLSFAKLDGPFYFTAGFGTLVQPTDALDVRGLVPEPSTLSLLWLCGLLLLLASRRPNRLRS